MSLLKAAPAYDLRFVLRPEQDSTYVPFEHGAAHPFRTTADPLSRVNAWWLADAALTSYSDPDRAGALYRAAGLEVEFIANGGSDCYVLATDQALILAFRGTEGDHFEDVVSDVRIAQVSWPSGRVHAGFAAALDLLWPALEPLLRDRGRSRGIWLTGHSLGAALATLAACRVPTMRGLCTFGSPRVGDQRFAASFNAQFAGRHLRYINNRDVVTQIPLAGFGPLAYCHVDAARWIGADGVVSTAEPPRSATVADIATISRALLQRATPALFSALPLLDHMPKAYGVWTWNDYQLNG